MNKINYQKELEKIIAGLEKRPKLLLHSCCAPCSSYVLTYLKEYFDIYLLYYNPNIFPYEEYEKRLLEQKRLVDTLNEEASNTNQPDCPVIKIVECDYAPELFFEMAKGLEREPEGGERCFKCYEMRLMEAFKYAKLYDVDFFTTTLSISPLKNAEKLNEIGYGIVEKYAGESKVKFLPGDFKKKNGYKTSIELSKKYELYRQNYCGCVFSKREE